MFELIYCSEANANISEDDIASILSTSRAFNKTHSITGCLLYYNGEFIQILEGEENVVQSLFSNIRKDKRHTNVQLIAEEFAAGRAFESWNMAFNSINPAQFSPIIESLFIENVMAFSDFAAKPNEATKLFWYMTRQLLDGNWPETKESDRTRLFF
ncbi:blue light sensor protein [Sphingobacteriaceae bacterium]|nr:blue light sensor protein [Sphingobacteriaceae bacterium]